MHELTQKLLEAIQTHGPLAVFIGVLVESVIVPIPSPLIIMGAGALLIQPASPPGTAFADIFRLIVLPGSTAATIGAFIGYGIGFCGGKPLILRLEKFIGFGWKEVEALEKRLARRRGGLLIMLLRALPVMPLSLISAAAGILRWPIFSFALWTWLGSVPRCLLLGYLGWLTHDAYDSFARGFDRMESLFSGLIVASAIALILWLRAKTRAR